MTYSHMKPETSNSNQTQPEHQDSVSLWEPMLVAFIPPVQAQSDEGDVGDGVDEFRDVFGDFIVVFAPRKDQ
jgi:hypothetical protein